jgi:hypothetical protein
MYPILNECPICKGELLAVTLECKHCDSRIHGRFITGPFANLTLEQIEFIELFIKNEGKLTRMQDDLSLSYPTIRNRLHEVIRALGYEPGEGEDEPAINEAQRRKILEDLENGEISYDDAIAMIKESETK